jgi:pyruvate dehydrogenase E1 component
VAAAPADLDALAAAERRVLWLATRIVDHANRERKGEDALKVGGHQASSASLVSIMTALYLQDLGPADQVAVKPHASPVLHAIEYLLGRLPAGYLTRLRDFGGLQAYPSRTKDPFPVDFSTGSVGLGAAAPLFGALAERYVAAHFGPGDGGRFISLVGDAELDEGNVWEAVVEPATSGLGDVLWIVDLNRQSLDRVVPVIKARQLELQFEASGWQVIELKYGRRLRAAFDAEGGDLLRKRIDEMPNQVYQSLFGASEEAVREALLDGLGTTRRKRLAKLLDAHEGEVGALVADLGGHDLADILDALEAARAEPDRPAIIFAYTIKGYGLPIAGRRLNHSALLSVAQIDALRAELGIPEGNDWQQADPESAEGRLVARAAARLTRREPPPREPIPVPAAISKRDVARASTQSHFGRTLAALADVAGVGERLVTVSPDVSVSTNLGAWINKTGVFGTDGDLAVEEADGGQVAWRVSPQGRHIELGISEMNLFLLLGQLARAREPLLPVGTLYDPFVLRGLEGLIYSIYQGGRFVVVGTPSGVSLSREGGAHQSTITPGVGMELPGLVYAEPCYGRELEWFLLDGLRRLGRPDGEALYLRLSTKPVDQAPFAAVAKRRGDDALRADVLGGGFWLREVGDARPAVVLMTCGAVLPEVLAAAELLAEEGVGAGVLAATSADRLYRGWRAARRARADPRAGAAASHLERLVPEALRGLPAVTAIDGASHSLAALGACLGMRTMPVGVDAFGQSGSQPALYRAHGIDPEGIAESALVAMAD